MVYECCAFVHAVCSINGDFYGILQEEMLSKPTTLLCFISIISMLNASHGAALSNELSYSYP
jgi:hypothetical protein